MAEKMTTVAAGSYRTRSEFLGIQETILTFLKDAQKIQMLLVDFQLVIDESRQLCFKDKTYQLREEELRVTPELINSFALVYQEEITPMVMGLTQPTDEMKMERTENSKICVDGLANILAECQNIYTMGFTMEGRNQALQVILQNINQMASMTEMGGAVIDKTNELMRAVQIDTEFMQGDFDETVTVDLDQIDILQLPKIEVE